MEKLRKFNVPPIWFLISLLLVFLIGAILPAPDLSGFYPGWIPLLISLIGIGLIFWTISRLRKHQTAIHPRDKPSTLITSGPFRFSRNPVYAGMALIIFAVALAQGALAGFLVVPLFALWIDRRFVRKEEENLVEAFGDEAREYIKRTRRW